jgi:asparagine synthase (glutamine-hydrolysing)
LRPGHFARYNLKSKIWKEEQYWNVYTYYNQPKLSIDYQTAVAETKELIRSASNYRMVADVPVGVFLSGGYDSTTVTAILQADRTEKLKSFTIAVPDIGLNEAPYAADIAKHLGTDHTEIECTEEEAISLIQDLPYFFDEPFADSSAIPTTLVSKMARKEVTVALSADGGDEIFAGYNRYDYLHRYGSKMNKIPGFVRKGMARTMDMISADHIPVLRNKYNFHNRYEKLKGILRNPSDETIMLSLSQQFTDEQIRSMMSRAPQILATYYHSKELQKAFYSPLAYMMAIDYQTYMLDDILQKVDRSTMTASLEGREPLLDHRIIEFAAQLPDNYKYADGVKKRILKDIAHQYVPKELMDRPKMGFAIPIGKWLQGPLKQMVNEYCSLEALSTHGLFNALELRKIIDRFYTGKLEYDSKVWYILMFQMWYFKWNKDL